MINLINHIKILLLHSHVKVSDTKRCGFGAVITQILRHCGVFLQPVDRVVDKKGMYQTFFDMRALTSTSPPLISTSSRTNKGESNLSSYPIPPSPS